MANQTGFYNYTIDEQFLWTLEPTLSKWEADFKVAVDHVVGSGLLTLTPDDGASLAMFVASQAVRTAEQRELIRQVTKLAGVTLGKVPPGEDDVAYIHTDLIPTFTGRLATLFLESKKWIIFHNLEEVPLWTSDNPVVRHNKRGASPMGSNRGFASPGIEIWMPLTPKLALLLCDKREMIDPSAGHFLTRGNVMFLNSLQLLEATRYLIAPRNDFSLAESMIKQEPNLARCDRPRLRSTAR